MTPEQIERIERDEWHTHFERLGRLPTPEAHAVAVAARVAAAVREEERALVCGECGEPQTARCLLSLPLPRLITSAQYAVEKGGGR